MLNWLCCWFTWILPTTPRLLTGSSALHVSFVRARFGDDVGSASLRAADGVSLVCVHAADDVLSFYLRVADAVVGCSGR